MALLARRPAPPPPDPKVLFRNLGAPDTCETAQDRNSVTSAESVNRLPGEEPDTSGPSTLWVATAFERNCCVSGTADATLLASSPGHPLHFPIFGKPLLYLVLKTSPAS